MKYHLIYLMLFLSVKASAQNLEWAGAFNGSTSPIIVSGIVADGYGNVYSCGYFSGSVDFDPGPGTLILTNYAGGTDAFITKQDASGGLIWAKQLRGTQSGSAGDIIIDITGNILVSGEFADTVDFDPGPTDHYAFSPIYPDGYLLKLDTAGNFLDVKLISCSGEAFPYEMVKDSVGSIYLSGGFSGEIDLDPGNGTQVFTSQMSMHDVFVVKLDSAGNFLWADTLSTNMGAGYDEVRSICLDPLGNLIVAGIIGNVGTLVKYDPAGSRLWTKRLQNQTSSSYRGVATDTYGNILCVGYFYNTTDFDPGPGVQNLTSGGQIDGFILKLGVNGDFIWVKQLSGSGIDYAQYIDVDNIGSLYVVGSFNGTTDFDPGLNTLLETASDFDVFIAKFNEHGDLNYLGVEGGGAEDMPYASFMDPLGNLYVAGRFYSSSADFDPGIGSSYLSNPGPVGIFVQKFSSSVFVPNISRASSAFIYPSPSTGTFTISSATAIDKLHLTDALGRELYTAQPHSTTSAHTVDLPSGLYYLTLHSGNTITTEKLVIGK